MSKLSGTSTLLVGGPGSGKTFSLATFPKNGVELFVVFTEPGGEEALLQAIDHYKVDIQKVHWKYIAPASPSWKTMLNSANVISQMSYASLTDIKAGIEKSGYRQFVALLETLSNFNCDRDGKAYGPVDEWGPDRAIALDSLSGLNIMAMDMVVGSKPVKHQGEWGVAMDNEERLIQKLCSDTRAFFVLTAHVEREINEMTGAQQLMAGALGRKLAPRLPRFFSDVVHAYRDGKEFHWSTISHGIDLKARTLPLQDKMAPDFGQILAAWKRRAETAGVPHTTMTSAGQSEGGHSPDAPPPSAATY